MHAIRRHTAAALAGMAALALTATWVSTAHAHGPTRQKVTESITIDAPPQKVWAFLSQFDGLAKWHPAVESSPATDGNKVGSVRQVTLKGGGALEESIERFSDEKMEFAYRLKDGSALPVSNYTSRMSVKPEGDGSKVIWMGAFYRKYMNNNPPKGEDDDAAIEAITGVYKSGLPALKKVIEAQK